MLSDRVYDVDSMHVSGAISDARCGFINTLVALDAFDANLRVEFIDVIVAFMIFRR